MRFSAFTTPGAALAAVAAVAVFGACTDTPTEALDNDGRVESVAFAAVDGGKSSSRFFIMSG